MNVWVFLESPRTSSVQFLFIIYVDFCSIYVDLSFSFSSLGTLSLLTLQFIQFFLRVTFITLWNPNIYSRMSWVCTCPFKKLICSQNFLKTMLFDSISDVDFLRKLVKAVSHVKPFLKRAFKRKLITVKYLLYFFEIDLAYLLLIKRVIF